MPVDNVTHVNYTLSIKSLKDNNMITTQKITKATFKSFVSKHFATNDLYIKVTSTFDGMVDCVMPVHSEFKKVSLSSHGTNDNTLGFNGVWLVGSSRDYFTKYEDDEFTGIEVYNCCGGFTVAIKK